MNRMRAALVCFTLIQSTIHPLPKQDTVSLTVIVEGEYPAESELSLKLVDLKEGTERVETLDSETCTFELRKGREYLACLKDCPPGFIPAEEFLITKAESTKDLEKTFQLNPLEVRIMQYDAGPETFLGGGELVLRDESDEEIFAFAPDEEGRVLDEEGNPFLFEASASYILAQKESVPGYERGCEQLILIPEFMEHNGEPLTVEYELEKLSGEEEQPDQAPLPFYEIRRIAQPLYGETDPFLNEPEEEESLPETPPQITAVPVSVQPSAVRIPEVYLSRPADKESAKIENRIERAGFVVRLLNEEGKHIPGASIAVLDENGITVDQWQSNDQDHVVEGSSIKDGSTYTVHMVKPAEGFSGAVIDIEHTVKAKPGDSLPVIELSDVPVKKQTALQKTETVKKTVNYALYACIAAAVCICAAVAAVCLSGRHKH